MTTTNKPASVPRTHWALLGILILGATFLLGNIFAAPVVVWTSNASGRVLENIPSNFNAVEAERIEDSLASSSESPSRKRNTTEKVENESGNSVSSWPPYDENPDDPNKLKCDFNAKFYEANSKYQSGGERVIRFRNSKMSKWYQPGCEQWGLTGEYKKRSDRKIYYGFAFGGEIEVLTVLLEEIYSVVDYIIILEGTMTWRGEPKPLFFPPHNMTHFGKYMDKIRYIPYAFDDDIVGKRIDRCKYEDPVGLYGKGPFTCRWMRQWGARDYIALEGAKDIGPNDVFIITDLDEILAREFVKATSHCDIWPEPEYKEKCSRVGIHVFGHRYHFGCTVAKNYGHFHPDLVLGRCLKQYGGEEVRRGYGDRKKYAPKPAGLLEPKYVGPGGWHLHSFLSSAQVAWKWFSRSGQAKSSWTLKDLNTINARREHCHDGPSFFSFDVRSCEPIPHLVRENPKAWRHYLGYVDDSELPDPFGVEKHFRKVLVTKRRKDDTAPLPWDTPQ
mmetsp:Transcript_2351/g.3349  ORF Transcript_2351/g.3349 Transcript_2351/m.3349 type:complete len:502 (-) Transcript_2351:123-1628(-)